MKRCKWLYFRTYGPPWLLAWRCNCLERLVQLKFIKYIQIVICWDSAFRKGSMIDDDVACSFFYLLMVSRILFDLFLKRITLRRWMVFEFRIDKCRRVSPSAVINVWPPCGLYFELWRGNIRGIKYAVQIPEISDNFSSGSASESFVRKSGLSVRRAWDHNDRVLKMKVKDATTRPYTIHECYLRFLFVINNLSIRLRVTQ